mmetsp:Transcript_9654/g.14887  ORF Transcript_9654/g.14887 Transcript_9654/m.14887 type:complete len:984 (-) Transcript_9654:55-3006(-)
MKYSGTMISSKWVYISFSLASVIYASCVVAFSPGILFHRRRHNARICTFPLLQPKQSMKRRGVPSLLMSSEEQTDGDNESEWKALMAAFQMYRAAYGDLKVPARFVVPSMPPWPKSAWGMKLGKSVASIRSNGKYVMHDETRRKQLEDIGFLWQIRSPGSDKSLDGVTLQQIFDAIEAYKREKGIKDEPFIIPNSFVVPVGDPWPTSTRGLPLGKKVSTMKTKTFQKKNPAAIKKLKELGIKIDTKTSVSDSRFQKVYLALQVYKNLNGDLLVPQPFVVPENTSKWPEETWGLRLGARVNAIRSQGTFVNNDPNKRAILDELGFVWTPPPSERGRKRGRKQKDESTEEEAPFGKEILSESPAESTIAAMDNLFGPSFDFGKESESDIEESMKWDLDGEPVLDTVNIDEDPKEDTDFKEPETLNETITMMTERALGVGIVEFVSDEGNRRRKGQQYKNPPLFNDDFGQEFVFDDVVEALTIYKKIHGDYSNFTMQNGLDFVIPESEANLFDEASMDSFDTVASARAAAAIAAYEEEDKSSESENLIAAEIKRLQEEVDNDLAMNLEESSSMNTLFAIEDEAKSKDPTISWPQHLAGMSLGYIVKRIRDGSLEVKHLPERKAALDDIGFDWGDEKYFLEVPFEKAFCSFYAYYMIRGDMLVPEDFIMPDEDPWPTALAGYEIGKSVKQVRQLQNFIESYHPEKLQMLRMLDFAWFPIMALPLDPSKGNKTHEEKMLEHYGHPNYSQLPEIPPSLMEKIFENGPVLDTDDPALWYKRYYDWEYVKDIWYELGCRDRAFALEQRGYPECAKEHAENYGTGYYDEFFELYDEVKALGTKYLDEKAIETYGDQLRFWRHELNTTIDWNYEEAQWVINVITDWISDPDDRLDFLEGEDADVEAEDVSDDDGTAEEVADASGSDDGQNGDYEYEYVEVEEEENIDGEEYEYEYVEEEAGESDDSDGKEATEGVTEAEEEVVDVEDELGLGE